ncbi:coenzyme F420-reducing hydrogenase delta subunit [Amycolatopsis bartoniae]|uniref:Uncharacterized protein n=1 Tax=Amycolatopsis bartoniae TaxID=941986 RepID=A0A8H9M2Y3_9PSEU|nr:fumarylacetoacetate hydrolase family protein [Amycolatopsis bartoniae]MBB2938356.1 coenzyme F420-reducing hydrogenase delta subunit [Amycolatopsis bartoniae]GHF34573.1 hypothetical protein GCM10017566_04100 [Amycolatopsis bartoniae]
MRIPEQTCRVECGADVREFSVIRGISKGEDGLSVASAVVDLADCHIRTAYFCGAGAWRAPSRAGDVVEVEVERLGVLRNAIVGNDARKQA